MPLPWAEWPAEARLLVGLTAFWSLAGLLVLGSASWWVASREMGDGAFYVKRQAIWLLASWSTGAAAASVPFKVVEFHAALTPCLLRHSSQPSIFN